MLWRPNTLKYKKYHKLKKNKKQLEWKKYYIKKGVCGLKILKQGLITSWQFETLRKIFTKLLKNNKKFIQKKLFFIFFPFKGLTKKPKEVRMGSGKGKTSHWVAIIKKGSILFEIKNISIKKIYPLLLQAKYRLGLPSKICLKYF